MKNNLTLHQFLEGMSKRICIYPKDIQRITGKSERYGRVLIHKIKEHFQKEKSQFVTIREFSKYTGISEEEVLKFISD